MVLLVHTATSCCIGLTRHCWATQGRAVSSATCPKLQLFAWRLAAAVVWLSGVMTAP